MLGIIVGTAPVVAVVALGEGSRQGQLLQISSLGTDTLAIFAGKTFGDVHSNKIRTLIVSDAKALASQPYVAGATPTMNTQAIIRYGVRQANALVNQAGAQYFKVKGSKLDSGAPFEASSLRQFAQDAVIDAHTRKTLFPQAGSNPVGKVI